jgi:spore coat polysaccharide biosynthesis protein SpsF (cytidylyltransferase family)
MSAPDFHRPSAVIVQARMGSSRLPGKVLKRLGDESVLWHVLHRCRAIRGIDSVCCAVSDSPDSDPVAEEAERCAATVVRGAEQDVLARYDQAATTVGADIVMRVTSDCPLIDPEVCAQVLGLLTDRDLDYACNNMPPTFPRGLDCEGFTAAALARAASAARDPYEREHVTPWLRAQPGIRRANLEGPGGGAAEMRWTLDYPEDLDFFRALFAKLLPPPAIPGYREVMDILAAHPEIAAINADRHDAAPLEVPIR